MIMVNFESSKFVNNTDFTETVYLHFRMIFKNTIEQNNLKDVRKISDTFRKIVEETELPDLPKTSVSYKLMNKVLLHIDWKKIAENSLVDSKNRI